MKRCPSCDFTFADTHRVCDFDGAELVDEPQRPSSPAKTPSRFGQIIKSPMFVAGIGLVFVLASAILVGYYDATNQLKPLAGIQPAPGSSTAPVISSQDSTASTDQARAEIKTPAASIRTPVAGNSKRANQSSFTVRRQTNMARASTGVSRQSARTNVAKNRSNQTPAADQREGREEAAHRKDPKLVAVLKTTWNVLKKPFRF